MPWRQFTTPNLQSSNPSLMAAEVAQAEAQGVFGQQRFDAFGPLDEAEPVAVEILLVAQFEEFLDALDAVGVEVVDREGPARILVDERERGTRDGGFGKGIRRANTLDQVRLAGSQFAVESYHIPRLQPFGQSAAERQRVGGRKSVGGEQRVGGRFRHLCTAVFFGGPRLPPHRFGCIVMTGRIISSIEAPPCCIESL